ncbi:MAG: IS6 family transposase [Betaproteobacteria bacterium]|nr:IS6 family transposase [Betaproteobacteria bacterium]
MTERLDKQHRYPWEVIELAVTWYQRDNLTYRAVSDKLMQHGVEVSHKTVFEWVQKFGEVVSRKPKRAARERSSGMQVEESYVKVNGEWKYMYRSTDSKGNMVNAVLRSRRNLASARSFLKRATEDN